MPSNLQTYNSCQRLAYWTEQIRQCRASGLTVAEWCRTHHISQSNYYRWQKAVFNAASQPQNKTVFVELPEAEVSARPQNDLAVRVTYGQMCLEIYSGASPNLAAAVCGVLKNAP